MVVITDNIGQLGNQIVRLAHFVAFSKRAGVRVAHANFDQYSRYFPAFAGDPLSRYPRPAKLSTRRDRAAARLARSLGGRLPNMRRPPAAVVRLEGPDEFDLGGEGFARLAQTARLVLMNGFLFRDYSAFAEHADTVRTVFTPQPKHLEAARRSVREARAGADRLVGIHIRRGDYATWNDGRYFWSDEEYGRLMTTAASRSDERTHFLVCSNDSWLRDTLPGQTWSGPGSEIEDMYALAHCDAIVGPPSTFTLWASFWGRTPLWTVEALDSKPQFRVALETEKDRADGR